MMKRMWRGRRREPFKEAVYESDLILNNPRRSALCQTHRWLLTIAVFVQSLLSSLVTLQTIRRGIRRRCCERVLWCKSRFFPFLCVDWLTLRTEFYWIRAITRAWGTAYRLTTMIEDICNLRFSMHVFLLSLTCCCQSVFYIYRCLYLDSVT